MASDRRDPEQPTSPVEVPARAARPRARPRSGTRWARPARRQPQGPAPPRGRRCRRRRRAATPPRAARSAAAAAMIRALSAVGRLDDRHDLASSAGSTEPSSAISGVRVGHDRPGARGRRPSSAGVERAQDEGAGQLADLVAGQAVASRRAPLMCDPTSSDRRIASSPSRIRLLTVPSGVAGPLGDLLLGETAEVGELDRLALDVGQGAERVADRVRIEARRHLRPDVGQGERVGRRRRRCSGSSVVGPPPPDGVDRAVVDDRQQPGLHAAASLDVAGGVAPRARGRRPGRRPRRAWRHS